MSEKPVRVHYRIDGARRGHDRLVEERLPFGFDANGRLSLAREDGPEVLFELSRAPGPLLLATRLPPEDLARHVELAVDGTPFNQPVHALRPGSRLDIVDTATRQRYQLVVDPLPFWFVRPRFLALIVLLVSLIGSAYGGYLYVALARTEGSVLRTATRLEHAERSTRSRERDIVEALARVRATQSRISDTVDELRAIQARAERTLRNDFETRIDAIGRSAKARMDGLSEDDVHAREALRREMTANFERLRVELAGRMVEAYQGFKSIEDRLLQAVAHQVEQVEPGGLYFKQIFTQGRRAVVFIRATYTVTFAESDEPREFTSFGTGFVIEPGGLALTAHHVLFPWRYERELLVLEQLGLAAVSLPSVRWSAWLTDDRVVDETAASADAAVGRPFTSESETRTLRFVYAPEPTYAQEVVPSPMGPVAIDVVASEGTDVAVFRLGGAGEPLPALSLAAQPQPVAPLDDVLVIGFPFSRLADGLVAPQAVRGFVRRAAGQVVELDLSLHPGLSGAPVLDERGAVVGLASAIYLSASYGMAVARSDIDAALARARELD